MNPDFDAIKNMGLDALGIDIAPKAEDPAAREARQKRIDELAAKLDLALSQTPA